MDTVTNTTSDVYSHVSVPTEYIVVKNITFAYRSLGRRGGIPLIFLQHFTGNMDNWDPAITDQIAQTRHIILFNNKGVASTTGETPDSVAEMAKDTVDFIYALGFPQVDLLGFSLGGFIAQEISVSHPLLIRKLILAGTGPMGSEGITKLESVIAQGIKDGPKNALINLFFTKSESGIRAGEAFMKRINLRTTDRDSVCTSQTVQAQAKAIITYGYQEDENHKRLSAISHPSLIVNGTADLIVPTFNSYILSQYIPNSKLIIWSDAGHGAIFQFHEEFVREVDSFLDR